MQRASDMQEYGAFLASKTLLAPSVGRSVLADDLPAEMFGFQRDLTRWALAKGRAAIWAGTGMGKTLMQLAWARHAASRTLILAPLAVAQQTVREGAKFGIEAVYAREERAAPAQGIVVTNYERLGRFDACAYGAVVCDESSILKSQDGKTRTTLIETFRDTPMRLCCTATPAPNDIAELANHAEFLGILTRTEMLAAFFVHDDNGWRLKGHAREPFYRWLASWAMTITKPSDLGYDDGAFQLPPLDIKLALVDTDYTPPGQLFPTALKGITDRVQVRRETLADRVQRAADLINADPQETWLAWVGLNEEGRALKALVADAVLVEGNDDADYKAAMLQAFADGKQRCVISKLSIAGFGMNFQRCARMVFVGLSDSFEQYYQGIRRCWRFGQRRPVEAHIVLSTPEEPIYQNVLRKEREAGAMTANLVRHVAEFERAEIAGLPQARLEYRMADYGGNGWRVLLGDSAERLKELSDASVDLVISSPPFAALYTYSASERDLGNARDQAEFFAHFGFVSQELRRVMRPGRQVCLHVQQIPLLKGRDGVIGLRDFRGDMIAHMVAQGFIYHGEVTIDDDPQAQAIRTKSKGLLFVQMEKDSSWSRPALASYILLFRAPGTNHTEIQGDVSREEWIAWARPVWYGIRTTDTLNVRVARTQEDDKHICPLQLGTIERCVRLWSNHGETVLDPFNGIGSTGYVAIQHGRQYVGIELRPDWAEVSVRNLREAEAKVHTPGLFDALAAPVLSAASMAEEE